VKRTCEGKMFEKTGKGTNVKEKKLRLSREILNKR
jgi:hypothetical protein